MALQKNLDLSHTEIDALARDRFGDPTQKLCRPHDLRFGTHGSVSVNREFSRFSFLSADGGFGVARGLVRPLEPEPEHQLDQLVLAQPLQISPIHFPMGSDIYPAGKGRG